jgi:hypothetical protein
VNGAAQDHDDFEHGVGPAEAAQTVELLLRQDDISGDARDVAVLRSSLCPIFKTKENGPPITDVFIEKRATGNPTRAQRKRGNGRGLRFAA